MDPQLPTCSISTCFLRKLAFLYLPNPNTLISTIWECMFGRRYINPKPRPYFLPYKSQSKLMSSSSSSSMESCNWVLIYVSLLLVFFLSSCSAYATPTSSPSDVVITNTTALHRNFTAVSDFRIINRKILDDCSASSPFLQINVSSNSSLSDDEFVTITVTGVANPSNGDWVAMVSPSNSE